MHKKWQAPKNLSTMAFGVAGPHATSFVPRQTSHDLILSAFNGGITAFDTGPSYGAGEAEKRLGTALRQLDRDKVFVSTKAGLNENKTRDFSIMGIQESLDRSLKRLDTDYVDALILHGPAISEMTPSFAEALSAEKKKGRVRYLGVAGRTGKIINALEFGIFDILMAPVHNALTAVEKNRLVAAQRAGLGIIAIEILNGASAGLRWPRTAADIWYCARALRQFKFALPQQSACEAIRFARNSALSDVVMISTTRQTHLQEALHMLDETRVNT